MSTHTASEVSSFTPSDRWRLHRGGIVNIWQYADQTFDLDGGRAVFQGTNGSGKSRTLELLLPLCLDGDLRQVGSKGFDTVSVRRLMLDEYPGGPNRIGYAWVELCRPVPDGGSEFLTCGVGVKASATSQQVSDSWRFMTSRRVGVDLHLLGAGDVPLGPAQLRDELGADRVLDEQTFRARIAATVYGVPPARYGDLLHLQRTLRNPDVGLKVLEGQLEQILSDALPPLDPTLIERLAGSFDDLESIRENIVRLTEADKALNAFLATYSGYALGSLRARAESLRASTERARRLRAELAALEAKVADEQQERASAERTVEDLEKRQGEVESGLDALRSHPAYTELQDLRDRQRLVDSARSAATSALDTAGRQRSQEERSVESVLGVVRRLATDTEAASEAAGRAGQRLNAAGLDSTLVPPPPATPAAEVTTSSERVRTAPEPQAEPVPVERRRPPRVDAEELGDALREAVNSAEQAASAAREHGALTLALHQQAKELDAERSEVTEAQRGARQAQLTVTEAVARRNQARQELSDAAAVWVERVRSWQAERPLSTVPEPAPEPPTVEYVLARREACRQAREQTHRWARPHLNQTRQVVTEIDRELVARRSQLKRLEDELAGLRAGDEHGPPCPEWVTDPRDPAEGAPFYRLVDFPDTLPEDERAGLEAALQASGLLNAWVTADGAVATPVEGELFATADDRDVTPNLADLLRPIAGPDCAVPRERVAALLASVPVDSPDGGLSVSVDGSWRAGVLAGSWGKETAEYVGAGAREGARTRRIAELEQELSELRVEMGEVERRHRDAGQHVAELERYLDSYPDDGELLTAHAKADTAVEAAQDAERGHARAYEHHERAHQRWQAARSELARSAGEVGLTADTAELEAAHQATSEARTTLDDLRTVLEKRCLATVGDLHETSLHHDAAVADRVEAESQAEQRCAEYGEQAAALTELTAAVHSGPGEELSDQISALEQQRVQVREQLPQAREQVAELREAGARTETQLETRRSQLPTREADAEAAREGLRRALRTPGLWAAAKRDAEHTDVPTDLDEAAELLVATEDGATESAVYNKLQSLQQSLSGQYDITADEQGGLLTVTITGTRGPQPVAEAARDVRDRLTEQRGYLDERYQSIFADYLIRDLAERLRDQITVADELCRRMNEVLERARSSQGVHVQLEWRPSAALSDDVRQAIELVRTPLAERSDDQDALLRRVFTGLIEAERDSTAGGYAEILTRALDYRSWHTFTVRVRDTGPEGKPRVRRLRQLSSGETRLVSYVTLFAAAAAFYDAIAVTPGERGPLRLVLLDEAFERLDDPTVARMLGLLVDLDMDWVITWPSGWGVSPKIPKMHIYDVLRPRSGHGIACTHTTWDGRGLERAES